MMSAPKVDDLVPASSDEAENERDKMLSDLLFRAATDDKVPSNIRVRIAFGFDHAGIDDLALLRLYRFLFLQRGVDPRLLSHWRTSASMHENIQQKMTVDSKLLQFLRHLDDHMKGNHKPLSFSFTMTEN